MTTFNEKTGTNNPFNGIDVGTSSKPTFADVDGDGDLDAVVGSNNGILNYFKNTGSTTAPIYVEQTGTNNPFNGIDVGSFSNPTLADVDGDGDLDAVVGEQDGTLNYFKNTGSATAPVYVAQTGTNNPFDGINVGFGSTPTFADVDGDGDLDAVVGVGDGTIKYYQNTGSATAPEYVAQTGTNNPFNGIDVGYSSTPTFADVDGDGDLDAFVGEKDGILNYFENTGSATAPVYVAQTGTNNPFNGIDVGYQSNPTFADVDGDGDLDAVVGENDGSLNYFENDTPPSNTAPVAVDNGFLSEPNFNEQTGTNNPFDGIDVVVNSNPTFADVDGDGDLDAVVGEGNGNLKYYQNTGSTTAPIYVEQTGTNNPFDGINAGDFSSPTLADVDEDGDLDAVVGSSYGTINYFENTGSTTAPAYVAQTGTNNPFDGINVGFFSAPTLADVDGDGDLDAVVGNSYGTINYFENDPVVTADPDPAFTTDEDTSFTTGNVLNNDSDADGDTLTVDSIDTTGTLGTVTNNGDGTFSYDPNGQFESLKDGETATDTFSYTIDDGNGGTDTATVTVTIDGVTDNTAPVAVDNGFLSEPNFNQQTGTNNPFNGIDVSAIITHTLADVDGDGDLDAVVGEFDGSLKYFKNTGSTTAPVYVAQTGTNNPFNGIDVGNYSTPTLADVDGDGDLDAVVGEYYGNLNYFENTGSTTAPIYVAQTGSNNPFNGIDVGYYSNPTFADVDGDGDLDAFVGEKGGSLNYFENTGSATAPAYVEQTGTNNPFNGINVGSNSTPTFADVDGDGDLDAVVGDSYGTLNYFKNTGSTTAPIYVAQTGTNNPFNGIDVGDYSVPTFADVDGDGDLDAVVGGNSGNLKYFENDPVVTADPDPAFTTDEDTSFTTGNVLNNDSDADGDTLTVLSIDTTGTLGTVTDNGDGTFDYDPNGQFESLNDGETATDTFSYTIDDGNGGTDTATVTVTIDGVTDNTAPVATDDSVTTDEDTATTGDVLANDTDAENDTLTVTEVNGQAADVGTQVTLGSGALLTLNADGSYNYDPNGQFESLNDGETATDSFTYTTDDGNGGTDTATVTVTIDGVNDNTAPVATDDSVTTDEDTATTGDVLANDTDAENDTLTVTEVNGQAADVGTQVTLGSGALLTLNADGSYNYDPNGQFESLNDGETATDTFDYTIDDDNGGTDTATVTVTIDGVNDVPPNSLESDYTIFNRNVTGTEFTVELASNNPVYKINDIATNESLNDFLTEAVLELGGTVVKNGTINENALEHFGGTQNPSITENEATDEVIIKIAGSGVGGQYKADFDNDADANAFQEFAQDLLGTDPTKTKIFQFNGDTNGGANNINILTNDEIISLNPDLSDGLRTADSLDFKWSGANTSGTQVRNNFDDFIGEMGDLFGGDQLTNANIHVIPTINEAQLTGTQVEISNGIGGTETWDFNNEQEAQNFLTFFDSTVDAFAV